MARALVVDAIRSGRAALSAHALQCVSVPLHFHALQARASHLASQAAWRATILARQRSQRISAVCLTRRKAQYAHLRPPRAALESWSPARGKPRRYFESCSRDF
jgi:hypothetical protein